MIADWTGFLGYLEGERVIIQRENNAPWFYGSF